MNSNPQETQREAPVFIMALALTRDKRFNAGNRMSRMLQEEEQDDFYKTTYGGFEEVKLEFLLLKIL